MLPMNSEWNWFALNIEVLRKTDVASRSAASLTRRKLRRNLDIRMDVNLVRR